MLQFATICKHPQMCRSYTYCCFLRSIRWFSYSTTRATSTIFTETKAKSWPQTNSWGYLKTFFLIHCWVCCQILEFKRFCEFYNMFKGFDFKLFERECMIQELFFRWAMCTWHKGLLFQLTVFLRNLIL